MHPYTYASLICSVGVFLWEYDPTTSHQGVPSIVPRYRGRGAGDAAANYSVIEAGSWEICRCNSTAKSNWRILILDVPPKAGFPMWMWVRVRERKLIMSFLYGAETTFKLSVMCFRMILGICYKTICSGNFCYSLRHLVLSSSLRQDWD